METPPRHTAGTAGTRPEHSALARHDYGLLAPAGTAVDPADGGTPVARPAMRAQGTGTGGKQRRRGTKPISVRYLRATITDSETRRGDPPNGPARLTRAAAKGGKEGGDPPPSSARPRCTSREQGGTPEQGSVGTHCVAGTKRRKETPHPRSACNLCAGRRWGGGSSRLRAATLRSPRMEEGGDPPKRQRALPAHIMSAREGVGLKTRRMSKGHPPSSVHSHRMAYREGGGTPKRPTGDPPISMCSQRTAY